MQLDTQNKKLIVVILAVGIVLLSGVLTVYALKYQAKHSATQQQAEKAAKQAKRVAAAPSIEKEADALFSNGDMTGAKAKYQTAATLYAEANNTEGEERVKMQLSLINTQKNITAPNQTDLSNTPIDRKLDGELGVPAPIPQP